MEDDDQDKRRRPRGKGREDCTLRPQKAQSGELSPAAVQLFRTVLRNEVTIPNGDIEQTKDLGKLNRTKLLGALANLLVSAQISPSRI